MAGVGGADKAEKKNLTFFRSLYRMKNVILFICMEVSAGDKRFVPVAVRYKCPESSGNQCGAANNCLVPLWMRLFFALPESLSDRPAKRMDI